ncbi:hypothetical protein HY441_00325 [Candidatus Microgenomates bacterium]|nr:hypothetical protein [Candidatus Microgenomates bacterium]
MVDQQSGAITEGLPHWTPELREAAEISGQMVAERVLVLGLPESEYVVLGGAALAVYGVKPVGDDIDLMMTPRYFKAFLESGFWSLVRHPNPPHDRMLVPKTDECRYEYLVPTRSGAGEYPPIHIHESWSDRFYRLDVRQLIREATVINGLPVASLARIKEWKQAVARPVDLRDVALIEEAQARQGLSTGF